MEMLFPIVCKMCSTQFLPDKPRLKNCPPCRKKYMGEWKPRLKRPKIVAALPPPPPPEPRPKSGYIVQNHGEVARMNAKQKEEHKRRWDRVFDSIYAGSKIYGLG
jgi:hypothetical protein